MTLSTITADTMPAPDPSLCPVMAELDIQLGSLFDPCCAHLPIGEQKEQFLVTYHRNIRYGQTILRVGKVADDGELDLTITHLNNIRLPDERIDTDPPMRCRISLVRVYLTNCEGERRYGYKTIPFKYIAELMYDGQPITYGALCSLIYPDVQHLPHDY